MQIRINHSSDWGVEHTDADVAAYEAAVVARVLATYPGADVEIAGHLGALRVRVYDCLPSEESEVIATVTRIAKAVWDDAAFWPGECGPRSVGAGRFTQREKKEIGQ